MENKTSGTGKAKKVVIGVATVVAVAAIAVPTALTLTGGNKESAGASGNESNKYSIIVSTGLSNAPDYNLSIEKGTTISELKTLLKAIDGYTITGIYKDEAMNHPYSDNETISSSTKIYIKFVAVTYTVNIYAEDGTTLVSTEEVNHKDSLSLVAPTKPEDNFATYEFKGWYNERNELVSLNEITSDLNIHPEYRTIMKEYKMGYIGGEFKDSISVTIGGEPVTLDSTYHYGAKIVIRATQKVGRDITEFKVKVGTGETQDILTETYRHEENGVVYYEYELTGNGDLSITYNEAASEYSIGTIPEEVSVIRNGHSLSSNETIYYGDVLEIKYYEDYDVNEFKVEGAEFRQGTEHSYKVLGNTNITFDGSYKYSYLTFTELNGGYQISKFDKTAGITDVVIPGTYHGKKIVDIKMNGMLGGAFMNSTSIVNLVIKEGIETVANAQFRGCSNLRSVTLPESLKKIGTYAFQRCSLTEITIPKGVTSINQGAFDGCNLTSVNVDKENNFYTSRDLLGNESNCLIEISSKILLQGSENATIPSDGSVAAIAKSAFKNIVNLTSLSIPDSVTSIGELAFSGCSGLTSIIIPEGVSSIESATFNGCSSLNTIYLPNSITQIASRAFYGCSSLQSIELPKSITSIGESAFYDCSNLISLSIPEKITVIEDSTFRGCSSLSSINLSKNITSIGGSAFYGCSSLISFTLPDKVTVIEAATFVGCSSLTSFIIPERITQIGYSAFSGCSSLTTITIPDSITTIEYNTFSGCSGLTEITISEYVTSIDSGAFANCTNLKKVTIESFEIFKAASSLTSAGNLLEKAKEVRVQKSFVENYSNPVLMCPTLRSDFSATTDGDYYVFVPSKTFSHLKFINDETGDYKLNSFNNSSGITDIIIPTIFKGKKVVSIADGDLNSSVFGNSNITSVVLPESLTKIGSYAFNGCSNLVSITIPNSVNSIGNAAFQGCSNLESVNLPSGLKALDAAVFFNCIKLKDVSLPSGLESIGSSAFGGCSSLVNITIPDSVTNIDSAAFVNCPKLSSVSLPSRLSTINANTFSGCTSLASITIPSSVSIIEATAFEGCTNLADVTIDSLTIYSGINGNDSNPLSGLIKYATKIRVPKSHLEITQNAYLSGENFASYDDGEYYVYVPASEFSYLTFTDCEGGCEVSAFDGSVTQVIIPALFRGQKVMGIKASTKGPTEAVFGNSNITSVKISEGVEYIGDCAFYGCQKLSSVNLGSVKTINSSAFGSCTKLYGINIPNSVETLSTSVFSGCTNLMQVTLSENIKSIGIYCFANTNIQTFTINGQYVYSVTKSDLFRVGGSENYPKTIKVLKTADNGSNSFINQNYTKTDSGNYWVYTLN